MENGFNNGSPNNDYQFTRPQNNAQNYGGYNNGGYNNAGYNNGDYNNGGLDTTPMTMGEWLVTLLIMAIPCVNIIMCFVWGFSSNGNLNRRNFCRAYLIILAVVFVLYLIIAMTVGVSLVNMVNNSGYYY